jgi:hypothetical protein
MTNLGGRSRLLLPIAAVLLLLASGCGSKPEAPSTRADVTAAPPSSWGDQATADRRPRRRKGGGRKICRLRAILDGRMLVSTETIGYAAHDSAALRSRIGALQGRLNRSMRLS